MIQSTELVEINNINEKDLININVAKSLFSQFNVGTIDHIEVINESRNFIYKIIFRQEQYVIKIFTNQQENPFGNIELFANDWLKNLPFVAPCVFKGKYKISKINYNFMIFKFVFGSTLLEKIQKLPSEDSLLNWTKKIFQFINSCLQIKINGFGVIDENKNGEFPTWDSFLKNSLNTMRFHINQLIREKKEILLPFYEILSCFYESQLHYFQNVKQAVMVPIDANPANFIVTECDEVIAIDLELFLGADRLLTYGAWMANIYSTNIYKYFKNLWENPLSVLEKTIANFYALFRSMNILIHLAKNTSLNISEVCPFGNNHTFIYLMGLYQSKINAFYDSTHSLRFSM